MPSAATRSCRSGDWPQRQPDNEPVEACTEARQFVGGQFDLVCAAIGVAGGPCNDRRADVDFQGSAVGLLNGGRENVRPCGLIFKPFGNRLLKARDLFNEHPDLTDGLYGQLSVRLNRREVRGEVCFFAVFSG